MRNNFNDKILLLKIASGDIKSFGEIYDYYITKIYRFIFFKVPSREIAEDLTSEVFTKTLSYLTNPDKKVKNLQAFLYQTARNLVIDYYRKNNQKEIPLLQEGDENYVPDLMSDQNKSKKKIEINLDVIELKKKIKNLKDEYREVIILRYLDEYSIKEIARILDKSNGAVRVLLHRAVKALKLVVGSGL